MAQEAPVPALEEGGRVRILPRGHLLEGEAGPLAYICGQNLFTWRGTAAREAQLSLLLQGWKNANPMANSRLHCTLL